MNNIIQSIRQFINIKIIPLIDNTHPLYQQSLYLWQYIQNNILNQIVNSKNQLQQQYRQSLNIKIKSVTKCNNLLELLDIMNIKYHNKQQRQINFNVNVNVNAQANINNNNNDIKQHHQQSTMNNFDMNKQHTQTQSQQINNQINQSISIKQPIYSLLIQKQKQSSEMQILSFKSIYEYHKNRNNKDNTNNIKFNSNLNINKSNQRIKFVSPKKSIKQIKQAQKQQQQTINKIKSTNNITIKNNINKSANNIILPENNTNSHNTNNNNSNNIISTTPLTHSNNYIQSIKKINNESIIKQQSNINAHNTTTTTKNNINSSFQQIQKQIRNQQSYQNYQNYQKQQISKLNQVSNEKFNQKVNNNDYGEQQYKNDIMTNNNKIIIPLILKHKYSQNIQSSSLSTSHNYALNINNNNNSNNNHRNLTSTSMIQINTNNQSNITTTTINNNNNNNISLNLLNQNNQSFNKFMMSFKKICTTFENNHRKLISQQFNNKYINC